MQTWVVFIVRLQWLKVGRRYSDLTTDTNTVTDTILYSQTYFEESTAKKLDHRIILMGWICYRLNFSKHHKEKT